MLKASTRIFSADSAVLPVLVRNSFVFLSISICFICRKHRGWDAHFDEVASNFSTHLLVVKVECDDCSIKVEYNCFDCHVGSLLLMEAA